MIYFLNHCSGQCTVTPVKTTALVILTDFFTWTQPIEYGIAWKFKSSFLHIAALRTSHRNKKNLTESKVHVLKYVHLSTYVSPYVRLDHKYFLYWSYLYCTFKSDHHFYNHFLIKIAVLNQSVFIYNPQARNFVKLVFIWLLSDMILSENVNPKLYFLGRGFKKLWNWYWLYNSYKYVDQKNRIAIIFFWLLCMFVGCCGRGVCLGAIIKWESISL